MTSAKPWNPNQVQLKEVNENRYLANNHQNIIKLEDGSYAYTNSSSEETMLHEIEPSIVNLKELMISQIKVTSVDLKSLIKLSFIDASSMGTDVPNQRTFISRDRHTRVTEDVLAERFGISQKTARATLAATLQNGTRSAILPLSRRYKADRQYNLKRLDSKFATDTFYSNVRSLIGNNCTQIYSH